jgi:hypothetical protein
MPLRYRYKSWNLMSVEEPPLYCALRIIDEFYFETCLEKSLVSCCFIVDFKIWVSSREVLLNLLQEEGNASRALRLTTKGAIRRASLKQGTYLRLCIKLRVLYLLRRFICSSYSDTVYKTMPCFDIYNVKLCSLYQIGFLHCFTKSDRKCI